MKRYSMLIIVVLMAAMVLGGCALSSVARKSVEHSSEEYAKWVDSFKARIEKMDDAQIGPFVTYIIQIIGEDKERLPREGERLIDTISGMVQGKPEGYKYTVMERAKLLGAWDRLYIILTEEAGNMGYGIIKKLVPAVAQYGAFLGI